MGPELASCDGRIVPIEEATVPVLDRGFQLGDAIYETLRTHRGRPLLGGAHIDRLRQSGLAVGLRVPHDDRWWFDQLDQLSIGGDRVLRITVSRGTGGWGLRLTDDLVPRVVITSRIRPPRPAGPLRVVRDPGGAARSWGAPLHIKASGRLGEILTLDAARRTGADEVLLRGRNGGWTEGTTSSLFLVDERGVLLTAPVAEGCLPGITRAVVIAAVRQAGIEVAERRIEDEDLDRAAEIFLASTLLDVAPVGWLDGRELVAPGPRTAEAASEFLRRIDASEPEDRADLGAVGL